MFRAEALSSRIAQMSIVDALYVSVALRRREVSIENLKKAERAIMRTKY